VVAGYLIALMAGVRNITAVEVNPDIVNMGMNTQTTTVEFSQSIKMYMFSLMRVEVSPTQHNKSMML